MAQDRGEDEVKGAIRSGDSKDVDPCVELWTTVIVRRDGPEVSASIVERAHEVFGRPRLRFAVVGAVPIAFGLTVIKEPGVALLSRLCVDPSTESRGLGTALLADAVEHAARARFTRIELQVRETNTRATGLYARVGFTPVSDPWVYDYGDRVVTWSLDLHTHLDTSTQARDAQSDRENGYKSSAPEVREHPTRNMLSSPQEADHCEDEPHGDEKT